MEKMSTWELRKMWGKTHNSEDRNEFNILASTDFSDLSQVFPSGCALPVTQGYLSC